MSLLKFIADLTSGDDGVHQRLATDPLAFIDGYPMSAADRAAVFSEDPTALGRQALRVLAEALDTLQGVDRRGDVHPLYWPKDLVKVTDVTPAASVAGDVTLTVSGRFPRQVRLELVRGSEVKAFDAIPVTDPLTMKSQLAQAVRFGEGDAGDWQVVVKADQRHDVYGTWDRLLKVG